jgi:cell division protein FtsL
MTTLKQPVTPPVFRSPRIVLPGRVTRLVEAYQSGQFQTQRRWALLFLLMMVAVGMVAALYLSVSARSGVTGREIQYLEQAIAQNARFNADLSSNLGALLSAETLQARARALGYRPVQMDEVQYLVVPGYTPAGTVDFSQPRDVVLQDILMRPEYNESLIDWLNKQIQAAALPLGDGQVP